MSRPMYTQLLSPAERAQCMKLGAITKLASSPSVKEAEGGMLAVLNPANVAKAVMGVSLLGGIPLGIAAYTIGKRINEQKQKEKELIEKAKYYRNATGGLERGLALPGA